MMVSMASVSSRPWASSDICGAPTAKNMAIAMMSIHLKSPIAGNMASVDTPAVIQPLLPVFRICPREHSHSTMTGPRRKFRYCDREIRLDDYVGRSALAQHEIDIRHVVGGDPGAALCFGLAMFAPALQQATL